jgi:hypothetical protein
MPHLRAALLPWAVSKVLFGIGWLTAVLVADELTTPDDRPVQLTQGLFAWDGAFYREIVERGYGDADPTAIRFFPLLPWLAQPFELVGLGDVALVAIALAAGFAAVAALHALVVDLTGERSVATLAAWCAALLPGAFTWGMPYAESLLVLSTVVAFLAIRRDAWWVVAACGVVGAMARPLGVLLVVAVLVEVVNRRARPTPVMVAALLAPAVGLAVVLANAQLTVGDAFAPLSVQEPLRGDLVDPFTRILRAIGDVIGDQAAADGLHTVFVVGAIVLLVLAAFRVHTIPVSWVWHGAAVLTVALAADNINSLERYVVSAPVFAVTMALVVQREDLRPPTVAVLAGLSTALVTLSFLGVYVP